MSFEIHFSPAGDCAVMVNLGLEISEMVNNRVHALKYIVEQANIDGILDLTPTYCALMITYSPNQIQYSELVEHVNSLAMQIDAESKSHSRVIEIPTLYGGEYGPDIENVAKLNGLDVNEVIRIHSEQTYQIYMLGFTPGFPYLGGLDTRIATPRLEKPRLKIPAGSVGIAGSQTGIYPIESPGGWQIIGQTPLKLYSPEREEPILLRAGDLVRFVPISHEDFELISKKSSIVEDDEVSLNRHGSQTKSIEILKPGMLTLVEDLGRYGYQQYGVPVSGVMDHFAAKVANALVSNPLSVALLEITGTGPEIRFDFKGYMAITGADLSPSLNGVRVVQWETIPVKEGDVLSFGNLKSGLRGYLAISGGIDVQCVMNSRSTYVKAQLGGLNGRALKEGDRLTVGDFNPVISIKSLDPILIPIYKKHITCRVILGPQLERFTEDGIKIFLSSRYQLTSECDRIGIRLEGQRIEHVTDADILSDGIAFGAIQVPGTGQPIVMMADRQTTGGYAKIANVISVDLWKLAQAKPGDMISFIQVSVEESHEIFKLIETFFRELEDDTLKLNY